MAGSLQAGEADRPVTGGEGANHGRALVSDTVRAVLRCGRTPVPSARLSGQYRTDGPRVSSPILLSPLPAPALARDRPIVPARLPTLLAQHDALASGLVHQHHRHA